MLLLYTLLRTGQAGRLYPAFWRGPAAAWSTLPWSRTLNHCALLLLALWPAGWSYLTKPAQSTILEGTHAQPWPFCSEKKKCPAGRVCVAREAFVPSLGHGETRPTRIHRRPIGKTKSGTLRRNPTGRPLAAATGWKEAWEHVYGTNTHTAVQPKLT